MAMTTLGSKAIGSIVKIKVNGTTKDFIVVHKGKPSSIYDNSFDNGVILLMKDLYENRQWYSNNLNDYENSSIHSYLNGTFLNRIEQDIRNAIVQVKIPYRPDSGKALTVNSGANGLSAKIFLLSGYEVGGTNGVSQYFPADGAKLDYFTAGTTTSANNLRIGYLSGIASTWFLRSPYANSTANAWGVTYLGELGGIGCSLTSGVRPALVLPASLQVSDDGSVVTNQPPVISGTDGFLGTKNEDFSLDYTVTDENNDTVTVTEKLDDITLHTYTATPGATNTLYIAGEIFKTLLNANQTITITANDGIISTTRTWAFTKAVNSGTVSLKIPLVIDAELSVALTLLMGSIPDGVKIKVELCNNAYDTQPAWEDATETILNTKKHFFSNKLKTAVEWGFNFRLTLERGTAEGDAFISSIGGNFK